MGTIRLREMGPLHEVNVGERLYEAAGERHAVDQPEDVDPHGPGADKLGEHDGNQSRGGSRRYDYPWSHQRDQPRNLHGADDEPPRGLLIGVREDMKAAWRNVDRSSLVRARELDFQPFECVK